MTEQTVSKIVKQWLNRWAKSFYDEDFGYSDCDMIDSAMSDLSIEETHRKLVGRIVDSYIASK